MCLHVQILYNTAPVQYTTKCTPVTSVQIGQSVTPAGTNIPTTTVPPVQVKPLTLLQEILKSVPVRVLVISECTS